MPAIASGQTWYSPRLLRKYPHLSTEDIPVWERFLKANPDFYESVAYDVHVGTGSIPPAHLDETTKSMWTRLTQKRIDIVGRRPDKIDIIEVKPILRPSALGQVLTYKNLYEKQFSPEHPTRAVILFELSQPDMIATAEDMGIECRRCF